VLLLRNEQGGLGLRPLNARSVILSTLLGTHPPRRTAGELVRAGELFGISEGAIRVALSRLLAAGDLVREDGTYRLSERLCERQARQDESRAPSVRPWDGDWELVAVDASPRPAAERLAFRAQMRALRIAELREGLWLRPANLEREIPAAVLSRCRLFYGRPASDPAALARSLWDLDAWAARARRLVAAIERAHGPAEAFIVSAATIRHLLADPVLPAELLPAEWPGRALREAHEHLESEHLTALEGHLRSRPGGEEEPIRAAS